MMQTEDIEKLVKAAAEFGNGKIHIIVNNAGFTWDGVIHKVCLSCSNCCSFFHSLPQS